MQGEQCRCGRRKNGDVKGIEPSDGRACNVSTAPQELQQKRSDNRDAADDLGADLRREKRKFVPRQKIPAETKSQDHNQQTYAANPGRLTRTPVRACQIDARHVNK